MTAPNSASSLQAETGIESVAATPETVRTILCVDDEPNILSALRRLFRTTGLRVLTAESGAAALDILSTESVDLIISDMRMPMMSGAELLQQVRSRWPAVTRLLLTGYADISSTISAINEGQIYRYITKPWNDGDLLSIVKDAMERKALEDDKKRLEALTARQNEELKSLNSSLEKKVEARTADLAQANDRLKRNYFNSIKTFSNLLELRGGQLMGHGRKVADLARKTAKALNLGEETVHELFIAALMHDIGFIGLSDQILSTPVTKLSPEDLARYRMHPIFGEQSLMSLDDMQPVATLIRAHHERHDGRGFPDGLQGDDIPIGARILSVVDTYEDLLSGHCISNSLSPTEARTVIRHGKGTQFDPVVTDAFLNLFAAPPAPAAQKPLMLRTSELQPGMVLAKDFLSAEGVLLLAADHVLTMELIERMCAFERRSGQTFLIAIKAASVA
jgi:response regulator RpfG family c-di-GMP phosphodiesterase